MFGAMWSEHCAYKHSRPLLGRLPSTRRARARRPGRERGRLDIGDGLAVVFKVESHNHPSAVEPYQGAATGVGGIIRDIFTMGARPIALLNSLRFGPLDADARDRCGRCHPEPLPVRRCGGRHRRLRQLHRHPGRRRRGRVRCRRYSGNPLVNAMCVGIARHDEITLARAAGAGQRAAARRRHDRPRRHPGRLVRLGHARRRPRGAPAGGAGRQPVPREAADGGLPRAAPASTAWSPCRTSARRASPARSPS